MSDFALVNLNDAVYRMVNPNYSSKYAGQDGEAWGPAFFNSTRAPLLHTFPDFKKVVSYKDWVTILGGNPTVRAGGNTNCLRFDSTGNTNYYQPSWGRTFGDPKGPNGRTIAEVKPLDEVFWYYELAANPLNFRSFTYSGTAFAINNNSGYSHPESVVYAGYHNSGTWYGPYRGDFKGNDWASNNVTNNSNFVLQPGVYLMAVYGHNGYNGSYYTGLQGYIGDNEHFALPSSSALGYNDNCVVASLSYGGTWRGCNCLFFVDSPVTWNFSLSSNSGNGYANAMFNLFRLTPEGFWE
jgi:hypothetical protein